MLKHCKDNDHVEFVSRCTYVRVCDVYDVYMACGVCDIYILRVVYITCVRVYDINVYVHRIICVKM